MKVSPVGVRGWPDRVFISEEGDHIYVEFKTPGSQPRKLQNFRHSQLRRRGLTVAVIDNYDDFVELLKEAAK